MFDSNGSHNTSNEGVLDTELNKKQTWRHAKWISASCGGKLLMFGTLRALNSGLRGQTLILIIQSF